MTYIFIFILIFLSIVLSYFVVLRSQRLSLLVWSLVAISLIYGIGFLFLISSDYHELLFGAEIIARNKNSWFIFVLCSLILLFSVLLGWHVPVWRTQSLARKISSVFPCKQNDLLKFGYLFLVLGISLRYLYVLPYGGFLAYLDYSIAIRSGVIELSNPFSFLQPFGYLSILASYFFWAVVSNRSARFYATLGLIVSFLFSAYILASWAGRVGFLLYLASFIVATFYKKALRPTVFLTLLFGSIPFALLIIYFISNFFGLKGGDDFFRFVLQELSFIYVGFFAQLEQGDLNRYFFDILISPIHLMPSSWYVDLFEPVHVLHTRIILGAAKGDSGVTGGVPIDLMTLGLMQLNVVGVFLTGLIFGMLIKFIDTVLRYLEIDELKYILFAFAATRIAFFGVAYAHPSHFMSGLFPLILLVCICGFASYIKIGLRRL